MTLLAIWYREKERDLYAIADSRLTDRQGGCLTDRAPKFSLLNVRCYVSTKKQPSYDRLVVNRDVVIGYTGSSSVAYTTMLTLQAYLSSFCMRKGGSSPTMLQIAGLAQKILEQNFRDFGVLWEENAKCEFLLFGFLPKDKELKAFHILTGCREK